MIIDTEEIEKEGRELWLKYGREMLVNAERHANKEASKCWRPLTEYWIEMFRDERRKYLIGFSRSKNDQRT